MHHNLFNMNKKTSLKVGDRVRFLDHVYEGIYSPYYDNYRGHTFILEHFMIDDEDESHILYDHAWLLCEDDSTVIVNGYVHIHDLELVKA